MRNYPSYSSFLNTFSRGFYLMPQALTALMSGLVIFVTLLGTVVIGFEAYYAGRIYPGVSVVGVDLSGLKPESATARLAQRLDYTQRGRVLLREGDKLWLASPAQLGLFLDPQSTAMTAYRFGRHGFPLTRIVEQFDAWYTGAVVPPQYIFEERTAQQYLQGLAAEIDQPMREASLNVSGADVLVEAGQIGRSLNIPTTLQALRAQLQTLRDGEVPLVIQDTHPAILDASQQAELARQMLSAPLTLVMPDAAEDNPGPWILEPAVLGSMLTIERVASPEGERYQVGLQREALRVYLENIAPQLARQPEDARFIFNDDTHQLEVIQPAVIGQALEVEATIEAINDKLLAGEHRIPLELDYNQPEVGDDATAEMLDITGLVSSETSYFYGSSSERIQNIQTAAARFHGVLVRPGETFSMAEILGDVSLDNGYAEALIIFGGRTIKGVGGGVCQVSTTLFRTAFFGGYPIVERYPHAYRVYYYELRADASVNTKLAGLDATVFVPMVDFKFTNDTPYWLLMETYVNPAARTLTWKFYSTSDGRQVQWDTSGLQNVEEPDEPLYEENPELGKGEIKQVDWEVEGADVTVNRTVTRNSEVLYEDTFTTHYMPWRAVYQYGPGTPNMPPDEDDKKGKKNR